MEALLLYPHVVFLNECDFRAKTLWESIPLLLLLFCAYACVYARARMLRVVIEYKLLLLFTGNR